MTVPEKRRRRIDEIGDESRRRILDAAEELFAEKGFDRTSFVDIATLSGISRGSIPWHFQNKDGLLMAVVERVIERYMTTDAPVPAEVSMSDIVGELRVMWESGPRELLYMILTEAMSTEGLVHEQYVTFFRSRRTVLAQWMQLRDATKRLSPADAKALAVVINGAFLGIELQAQIDPDSIDLDRTMALLAGIFDSFLAGTELPPSAGGRPRKATKRAASTSR